MVAVVGLLAYNRVFAVETRANRRLARQIMIGVYTLLLALGAWYFYSSTFRGEAVVYRTMVQAVIMLVIGAGGIAVSMRERN